jgi:putative FmdB family regulatory protein
MPTYEYECGSCKHRLEAFQSITAAPLKKCPECGRRTLKRLISAGASVIFKGSGFYETDYRSESYKKAAKADADAASGKSPDKDSTKSAASDAKPKEGNSDSAKSGGSTSKE